MACCDGGKRHKAAPAGLCVSGLGFTTRYKIYGPSANQMCLFPQSETDTFRILLLSTNNGLHFDAVGDSIGLLFINLWVPCGELSKVKSDCTTLAPRRTDSKFDLTRRR